MVQTSVVVQLLVVPLVVYPLVVLQNEYNDELLNLYSDVVVGMLEMGNMKVVEMMN